MNRLATVSLGLLSALAVGFGAHLSPARADEAEVKVTIPATSREIWQAIDHHVADLRTLIEKGDLKEVHMQAYAIRDLVRALPSHSPTLPADVLTKVKAQSKFVDTLAERLDRAGDSGDKPATIDGLGKLEQILRTIRAQYGANP